MRALNRALLAIALAAVVAGGAAAALIVSSDFAVGTPLYSTGQVFVVGGYLAVTNSSGTGSLRVVATSAAAAP